MEQVSADFRRVFEALPTACLLLSPSLYILGVSQSYLDATMTRRADIVGKHLFEVFPDNPDDTTATGTHNLSDSLRRVLQLRRPDAMAVQKYDIRKPPAEGGGFEVRYWSPINTPVLSERGEVDYIIHAVTDVTAFVVHKGPNVRIEELPEKDLHTQSEIVTRGQQLQEANTELRRAQKDLESQLLHAQKMEAVGRLAGGVAHDFNNLLSVIMSFAQLAQETLPEGSAGREDLSEVLLAAERAGHLTTQLLAFSRQQVIQPRLIDIDRVVTEMSRMSKRLLGADIELTVLLRSEGALVWADPGQIEQVIVNLVVNARDAMPTGGKLTIETSPISLGEVYASEHIEVTPGPYVMLAVTDTGIGMPPEVRRRVFEPFFTTKDLGKGTGLGLSTVYGIVKQAGGSIFLYSEPGKGTTFKIYLPIANDLASQQQSQRAPQSHGGDETLLVVEDEEQLRIALVSILTRKGYTVLSASNGDDALSKAAAHQGPIHLLLTDVIMPAMSGRHLAEELSKTRPAISILYMSGYTDDTVVRHGVLSSAMAYLQKPFTPDTVAQRVREMLDQKR